MVNGLVCLYRLASHGGDNEELARLTHHKDSVRDLSFNHDGSAMYTVSADTSVAVIDMASFEVAWQIRPAHDAPVNCVLPLNEQAFATGDDDGAICIWDVREPQCVLKLHEHVDLVSSLAANYVKRMLVSSSGDGTVVAYNMRKGAVVAMSEEQEAGISGMVLMADGRSLVTAGEAGALACYRWGAFGVPQSGFVPTPPIESICKLDEESFVTGSSDGLVRLFNLASPHVVDVVAEHSSFPVEALAVASWAPWLATVSHDNQLRFWSTSAAQNRSADARTGADAAGEAGGEPDSDDESEGESQPKQAKRQSKVPIEKQRRQTKKASFFSGLL